MTSFHASVFHLRPIALTIKRVSTEHELHLRNKLALDKITIFIMIGKTEFVSLLFVFRLDFDLVPSMVLQLWWSEKTIWFFVYLLVRSDCLSCRDWINWMKHSTWLSMLRTKNWKPSIVTFSARNTHKRRAQISIFHCMSVLTLLYLMCNQNALKSFIRMNAKDGKILCFAETR